MKKTIYLLLYTVLCSPFVNAQSGEEKQTNQQIKEQIQGKWDANAQKVMEGLFKQDGETKYEDKYSFDVALLYHIDVFKKNGNKKEHSEMEILVNKTDNCIAMIPTDEKQKQESLIVYDAENKSIITLLNDENESKTGIAMKFDPSKLEMEKQNDVTFEKLAEQKEILGYTCHKYISKDEDQGTTTEFWITEEVDLDMQQVFGVMAQGKSNRNKEFSNDYPKGMLMESTTVEENGTSSTMKIAELDLNSKKEINTSDYQMMNMGSLFAPSTDK